ncbi:D-alanyl-D-alanine carboxypeptidase/D-alanyl-D-alanine-endopeptidase [Nonomuraea lactucae]|uniref:D-alanyl-D-alanine carboxypeptidase/D-alanyl-D-alanine endopeptidase n=1 Tax=Nonomuraea lactucae TaxID=2249762 RepID=UPI0019650DD3|nr:D-alanyl-D-alanine carboxypeptidase/D-alanyl-D-alanine-endopeptidase [Nonomuraea lactucae]
MGMAQRAVSRAVAVALTLALAAGSATVADIATPGVADLTRDIDRILGDSRLSGGRAGVVVRSVRTGELLYQRDPDMLFTPASLVKLLTSAAALDALGPGYRFATTVLASGRQRGTVLEGDLYLKGTGDPTMLAADYDALAAQVAASGIRTVTGRLVSDDTWFDRARLGAGWLVDDEPFFFSAQISALTAAPNTDYDAGSLVVNVAPGGRRGAAARVTTTPPTDHVSIDNRAVTGRRTDVVVERPRGANRVVVTGTVAGPASKWISVDDPTGYAASLFRQALAAHGVAITGGGARGAAPKAARNVARHASMPLSELVRPFVKLSNNIHAEVLTKAMGRQAHGEGTWEAGLRVVESFAARHGVRRGSLRDGSGLSRLNAVTPRELTGFLVSIRDEPWFGAWYAALPIAGEDDRLGGGTLRRRMARTPAANNVHAKTGSMTAVSGLSGYVDSSDGEPLAFSIVLNNHLAPSVKRVEDAIAVRLSRYSRDRMARVPVDRIQPDPLPAGRECSWQKPIAC